MFRNSLFAGRVVTAAWAFGLAGLACVIPASAQERRGEVRTITVAGTGKVSARPDIAEVQVGVVTQAATAVAALQANNEAMDRMTRILKERGVADKDIQTVNIQVAPQYSQPQPRPFAPGQPAQEFIPRIVGYRVDNSVRITAREIEKLGSLLDGLVEGGANQVRGIQFRIDHPEKLLDQARQDAMTQARHKAQLLAQSEEVGVGLPLKIEESSLGGPIAPPRGYATAAVMAAPAMPVSPGEQEISVRVSVVYELLPKR